MGEGEIHDFRHRMADRPSGLQVRLPLSVLCYTGMIAAWTFDFRSDGAGQGLAIQAVFLVAYGLATIAFFLVYRGRAPRLLFGLLIAVTNFLGVAIATSILREQDPYGVLRQVSTVLIYLLTACATAMMVLRRPDDLGTLRTIVSIMSLAFLLSTLAILLATTGISADRARFEIIGTSIVVAIAYPLVSMRFALTRIEWTTALLGIGIVALSATRTWLVVGAVQALFLLLSGGIRPATVKKLIGLGALGIVAVGALQIGGLHIVERWTQRLLIASELGIDPTALTRQRQADSMLASIAENPLWGAGLQGQSNYWLEPSLGGEEGMEVEYGFGHSQHLGIVFVAGLVGGAPLLIVQFWQGIMAWRFCRRTRRDETTPQRFLGVLGALIVIGTLSYGWLGGTFVTRGISLWYGVGTGLLLGCIELAAVDRGQRHQDLRGSALFGS